MLLFKRTKKRYVVDMLMYEGIAANGVEVLNDCNLNLDVNFKQNVNA